MQTSLYVIIINLNYINFDKLLSSIKLNQRSSEYLKKKRKLLTFYEIEFE